MATESIDRTDRHPARCTLAVQPKFEYIGHPDHLRRRRGGRLGRDPHLAGLRRVSDHQLHHDGRRVQSGRRQRRAESVGRPARVRRAGERAFGGDVLRRLRGRRRARDQFHVRPGPGADEGSALHDLRQAAAGGVQHRRPGADEPGPQRPRRARRRDERRRLRLGNAVRPQCAGGRRPVPDRPPRGRGVAHAVHERAGRLPHDAHGRKRAAARAGVHEGVRRQARRTS